MTQKLNRQSANPMLDKIEQVLQSCHCLLHSTKEGDPDLQFLKMWKQLQRVVAYYGYTLEDCPASMLPTQGTKQDANVLIARVEKIIKAYTERALQND